MKKLTIIMLVALMIPATAVLGQMRWHDKDVDKDVFIYQGKGPGMGHGMKCDMGPGKGMGMRGHGIMAMAEELGLTDDQKEKISTIATEFRLKQVDRNASVKKAQITLKALMRSDADEGKVLAAIDEVARLKADVKKAQYSHHQQVKGLLTDEQVEKLKECRFDSKEFQFMGKPGRRGGMQRRIIEVEIDDD